MARTRKKILILHAGAHKTGSSLIQKYLQNNIKQISQYKIGYIPRSKSKELIGWRGDKLFKEPDALLNRIERKFKRKCNCVIVSFENLLGRPFSRNMNHLYPDGIEIVSKLSSLFQEYEVRFVYYIRPQIDFLQSYYLQLINEGKCINFSDWYRDIGFHKNLSWAPLTSSIISNFKSNAYIKDFTMIKNGQDKYLEDFMSVIYKKKVLPFSIKHNSIHNISIGDKGIAMSFAINHLLETKVERKIVRRFLQKNFNNIKYPRPTLLSEEECNSINNLWREEYNNFFEE